MQVSLYNQLVHFKRFILEQIGSFASGRSSIPAPVTRPCRGSSQTLLARRRLWHRGAVSMCDVRCFGLSGNEIVIAGESGIAKPTQILGPVLLKLHSARRRAFEELQRVHPNYRLAALLRYPRFEERYRAISVAILTPPARIRGALIRCKADGYAE